MPRYTVEVREIWIQPVEVEAANPIDAKHAVLLGEGVAIEDRFEFSHCLNSNCWTVEEVKRGDK